jgi:hypothetical protein
MKTTRMTNTTIPSWPLRTSLQCMSAALLIGAAMVAFGASGDGTVDRANVSKTPEFASNKAKIGQIPAYTQARKADGTAINPVAGKCTVTTESGAVIEIGVVRGGKCQVQPQVVSYVDAIETGAQDTFAAVSLDDGQTWRRMNLSHSADRAISIPGYEHLDLGYGTTKKPALSIGGRKMLVAWTGTYCPSGNPSGFVDEDPELKDGYPGDLYQVAGPQGVVDYAAAYDRPELGVKPMSCLWAARGTVDQFGNIVWAKAEQITSGRRDAYQLTTAAAGNDVGFAMVWQEDPVGLNPGSAAGPGDGMSGAVVSKKTDIWYNSIKGADFLKGLPVYTAFVPIEPGTPPESPPDGGRPVPTVAMSSPVRLSDNAACKVEFLDGKQIHHGAPYCELPQYCATVSAPDANGNQFCVTASGVVLNGDTGASRPNLFLQTYQKPDGTYSAEAIIGYEETKGLGGGSSNTGSDKEDAEDIGKNVIYEHFANFAVPDVISPGNILNMPELGADGQPLMASDGVTPLYRNARRIRFVIQPKSQKGSSGTVMVALWKEGPEGKGRNSDIMIRRAVNGYAFENFVCEEKYKWKKDPSVCLQGVQNLSSPTVQETVPISGEPDSENSVGVKVTQWKWLRIDLQDATTVRNPYDDARAHRGVMRGNFLAVGFTWTPNWAAARNGNDVYDYYIRRSFDGGQTWTSMGVQEKMDQVTKRKYLATVPGGYQEPVNVSNLRMTHSNSITAIEPRIVATPGTILANGLPTGVPDDVQNPMVFFTSFGTSSNPDLNLQEDDDEEAEGAVPLDLYWSWTDNYGESYKLVERIAQGTGETVLEFDWLAKNDDVHEGEAQLRMNPAGTSLSAAWLGETNDGAISGACIPGQDPGSDICYRRITGLDPLARYDTNHDGILTLADRPVNTVSTDPLYDMNEDGLVNLVDLKLWDDAYAVYLLQNPAVK